MCDLIIFAGAMPGIKNPILVAKMLVLEQQKGLLPLGRVPPGKIQQFLSKSATRNIIFFILFYL